MAFDFARPDAAVEQPAEKAVEGLSVPQVGQIAVNDWRQYVRAVAINEKFVQYLLVVDAPQAAGYIPFGRYDECLVAAFAVGACPVFVRAVEVVVVVERLQHVEQFARKREPVQVFVNIDLHEVDTVLAGRFGIEQQRRTAECFVQQGESVVYVAEDVDSGTRSVQRLPAGQTGDFLMDGAQLFRGDPVLFDRVVQAGPHLLLPILCVTRLCEPLQAVREFVADAAYFVDPSTPHLLRERFGVERGEEFDDLFRIVFAASAQTVKVAELRRTDDRIDPVRPVEEQRVRSQCAGEKRVFGEFVRLRKNGEYVVCRRGVEKIGKFSLSALGGGGHRQESCQQKGK